MSSLSLVSSYRSAEVRLVSLSRTRSGSGFASALARLSSLAVLSLGTLAVVGCGSAFSMPDSGPGLGATAPLVTGPSIQGTNYGGHAPLVGAKVYVLTPSLAGNPVVSGASSTTASTSLMTASATTANNGSGGFPRTLDTSGGVTNGMYYVTTDASGSFNLSGNYSCSVNQEVYIAAVGGSPSYSTSVSTFYTQQVTQGAASGGMATFTFSVIQTLLTPAIQLFYVGEQVTLGGYTGNLAFLNGQTVTVTLTSLDANNNSTFSAVIGTALAAGTYGTTGTTTSGYAIGHPTNNPAVVNMANLGLCPASGNFQGTIQMIYMNEVSTVALANAAAQFGTDAFHIGVKTGGPLDTTDTNYVLNSLKMAMGDSVLLYDVTGANLSTAINAGEGHIARAVTAGGNGTVPQARLDTLGNILAACVDSANSYNSVTATGGTQSPQCATLFKTATSNGRNAAYTAGATTYPAGTAAADTGAAAFNIAHWPAGLNNSSFQSSLYSLPSGNQPFQPALTAQPQDFLIEVAYTAPCTVGGVSTNLINGAAQIAIDGGNYVGTEYNYPASGAVQEGVWIANYFGQPVKMLAATGTVDCTTSAAMAGISAPRAIAIDAGNNAWITAAGSLYKVNTAGALQTTVKEASQGGLAGVVGLSFDPAGRYLYLSESTLGGGTTAILKVDTTTGNNVASTNGDATGRFSVDTCLSGGAGTAYTNSVDSNGFIYSVSTLTGFLCVIDPASGARVAGTTGIIGGSTDFIDGGSGTNAGAIFNSTGVYDAFWGAAYFGAYGASTDGVAVYSKAASPYYTANFSYDYGIGYNQPPGNNGGPNGSSSTAVDGAGNVWSGNVTDNGVVLFSPANNYYISTNGGYAYLNPNEFGTDSVNPAIDRAGNVWLAEPGTTSDSRRVIYELIGAGAPTVTPLYYNIAHGVNNGTSAGNTNYVGQRPN